MRRLAAIGVVMALTVVGLLAAAVRFGAFNLSLQELEQAYTVPQSRFVNVEGVRFHYLEKGTGPAVLLLHASRGNARMWAGWMDALAADYRVIAVDGTAEGLTGLDSQDDYTLDRQVKLMRAVLTALQLERVAIAGTSYGGIIAYRMAAEDPRVVGLILSNAAGLPRAPGESPNRPEPNPLLNWVYQYYWPRSFFERSLPRAFVDSRLATPALIQEVYDFARRTGAAQARQARLAQFDIGDVAATLARIEIPVLIQWSSQSIALPVTEAERFRAYLINAEVQSTVYPGKGHWLVMEAAAETARAAQRFLKALAWNEPGRRAKTPE